MCGDPAIEVGRLQIVLCRHCLLCRQCTFLSTSIAPSRFLDAASHTFPISTSTALCGVKPTPAKLLHQRTLSLFCFCFFWEGAVLRLKLPRIIIAGALSRLSTRPGRCTCRQTMQFPFWETSVMTSLVIYELSLRTTLHNLQMLDIAYFVQVDQQPPQSLKISVSPGDLD